MEYTYDSYLIHHGIKGQTWGIRRGPPYPIDDKVLKKGTVLANVSNKKKLDKTRSLYTFNPEDEWDSKVYRGPFSLYSKSRVLKTFIYENQYRTTEDLKLATKSDRLNEFIDMYKDTPAYGQELSDVRDYMLRNNFSVEKRGIDLVTDQEIRKANLLDSKTKTDYKVGKFILDFMMEKPSDFKLSTDYYKRMSEKYDAMVDDHNVNMYNRAHDPLILFVGKRSKYPIEKVGKTRKIRSAEMTLNYVAVRDELAKKGIMVQF